MTSTPSFYSPMVAGLVPYVPGEQPAIANLIKLNTNENPYPPSPKALAAIRSAAEQGLQLYPDPESSALRRAIAERHGLEPAQVFVGNGSDEVLAHAFFAFFQQPGCPLLQPDISYSFYQVYCGLYGIAMETVPLAEGLALDVHAFARSASAPIAGVVVANPNAPTGRAIGLGEVEALLRLHPQRVVLVDEAYVDFGAESALALVSRHPNLLVVQTLSKSRSLAGPRPAPWRRWRMRPTSRPPGRPSSIRGKAWRCSWKTWVSRCCPRRPTSCLYGTPGTMLPSWLQRSVQ